MLCAPGRLLTRPRGFDPRRIPNLGLWLDAGLSPNTLNSGNVAQWNDLSGNGRNDTQSTAANQPAFTTGAINGLPALTFGGTKFFDNITISTDGTLTTFHVVNYTAVGAYHNLFEKSGGAVPQIWFNPSNAIEFDGVGGIASTNLSGQNIVIETVSRSSGTTAELYVNGTLIGTKSIAVTVPTSLTLAQFHRGATDGFQGTCAAEILYGTDIGAASRAKVRRYLGARYGITVS